MVETLATLLALDDATKRRVERLAADRKQRVEVTIHDAVVEFVDREERVATFRSDALEAWADYQATGQHVTAREVDAWLSRLEQGDAVPPPECHD